MSVLAPARVRRGRSGVGRIDAVLATSALALTVLGTLLVWAATRPRLAGEGLDPQAYLKRHLITVAVGLACCAGVAALRPRHLRTYAPAAYLASCAGLVAVLVVGSTVNGARSWIALAGGFQLQPAELAKIGLILGLAAALAAGPPRAAVLVLAGMPMALVLLQPDFGSTAILAGTSLGVLGVSRVPARWLAALVLGAVVAAVLAVHLGALKTYQLDRFRAFADPTADAQDTGYNTAQARIAVRAGGVTGTGLFRGARTNGRFVPEQHTDFVFTVAGEELGLLGGGTLIALLGVILWCGTAIASRAPDEFGRLVAVGIVAWWALQAFVNIGMTLGIMPVTGLPLPFVSYGGSAMIANLTGLGLLLNVSRRSAPR